MYIGSVDAAGRRADDHDGVWRSLVARQFWELDVGGSNPLTPIPGLSGSPAGARSSVG